MPDPERSPRRIAARFLVVSGIAMIVGGLYLLVFAESTVVGGVVFAAGSFDLLAAMILAKGG